MTLGFYDEMKLVLQDEEMSWLDKSCLHLAVRKKDKIETVTFQVCRAPAPLSVITHLVSPVLSQTVT